MRETCVRCQKPLTADEVAVTKKLVNRGARQFYCIDCLAERFEVESHVIEEKIRYLKSIGCTLFTPEETRGVEEEDP